MKIIHNTKTGQEYIMRRTADETNGERLEMEVTYCSHSHEPPAHYHPLQTEHFKLLSGEMSVRINGKLSVLKAGDTLDVLPNTVHSMWNSGEHSAVMQWVVTPALNSEAFIETLSALANAGKTDEKGAPNLFQIALTMRHFSREFRLAKPSAWVQRLVFGLLAPIGMVLGYKPIYGG
jgi:quercetin dioxygenase-like cupin family protein